MRVHIIRVGAELVMHVRSQIINLLLQILNVTQDVGLATSLVTCLGELAHLAWHVVLPDVGHSLLDFLGRGLLDAARAYPWLLDPFETPRNAHDRLRAFGCGLVHFPEDSLLATISVLEATARVDILDLERRVRALEKI